MRDGIALVRAESLIVHSLAMLDLALQYFGLCITLYSFCSWTGISKSCITFRFLYPQAYSQNLRIRKLELENLLRRLPRIHMHVSKNFF